MPSLCDRIHVAIVKIVEQRVDVLAMSVSHLFLRERIARTLVLSDLINVRIDAEFVERAAEKHHVGSEAVDKQLTRWRHNDLVARRCDVILLVQTKLDVCVDRFAGRTKICDRVANFFSLSPTNTGEVHVVQNRLDPFVDFRLLKLHQKIGQRLVRSAKISLKRIVGAVIWQYAGDAKRQHAVVANGWFTFAERSPDERNADESH